MWPWLVEHNLIFQFPQKWSFSCQAIHRLWRSWYTQTFWLWAKPGTAVVSGSCAHVCTLSLLDFCISFRKNETAILLKTKVEMPNSVSTNRNRRDWQKELDEENRLKGPKCKQNDQKYAQDYRKWAKSRHSAEIATQGTWNFGPILQKSVIITLPQPRINSALYKC